MSYFVSEAVTVTTDGTGAATAFSVGVFNGFLHTIVYTKDGSVPYSDGVVIAITGETSGLTLWSQTLSSDVSTTISPRLAVSSTAGAASLYAAAGTAVTDKIPLANERVKIVLSSAGNAKVGVFRFLIGG